MGAKDGHSKTLLTGENDPGATNVTDVSNEKLCVKLTLISFPKLNRTDLLIQSYENLDGLICHLYHHHLARLIL